MPACAQDAARVLNGEQPDVRMVRIGGRRIVYREPGSTSDPHGLGYHVSGNLGRTAQLGHVQEHSRTDGGGADNWGVGIQ